MYFILPGEIIWDVPANYTRFNIILHDSKLRVWYSYFMICATTNYKKIFCMKTINVIKKNYAKYLSTNYILISKVTGTGLENDVSSPTKNKCTDASMCPIFQWMLYLYISTFVKTSEQEQPPPNLIRQCLVC